MDQKLLVVWLVLSSIIAITTAQEDTRAASNCQNCECQCDSYKWKDSRGRTIGNCRTADNSGARFCYVSGRAKRACRDVQQSQYRKDSVYTGSRKKFYSYEACETPERRQCYRNNRGSNCGDGDNTGGGYPGNGGGYPGNGGGYPGSGGGYPGNGGGFPGNGGGNHGNGGGYPNVGDWLNNNGNNGFPGNNRPNNNRPNYPNNNRPNYPNNSWRNNNKKVTGRDGSKESAQGTVDDDTSVIFA